MESRRRVQIAARSLPVRRRAADDLIVEKKKILDRRCDRIEGGLALPRSEPNFEDTFLARKRYRLSELRSSCGISLGSLCPGSCAGKCSHHQDSEAPIVSNRTWRPAWNASCNESLCMEES